MTVLLEDFLPQKAPQAPSLPVNLGPSEEELAALKSEAFEQGYSAGWEDANRATQDKSTHISEALGVRLSQIEVDRAVLEENVLNSLLPQLDAVVTNILPAACEASFKISFLEEIHKIMRGGPAHFITITHSESDKDSIINLLSNLSNPPGYQLKCNENFGPSQIKITAGHSKIKINTHAPLQALAKGLELMKANTECQ